MCMECFWEELEELTFDFMSSEGKGGCVGRYQDVE